MRGRGRAPGQAAAPRQQPVAQPATRCNAAASAGAACCPGWWLSPAATISSTLFTHCLRITFREIVPNPCLKCMPHQVAAVPLAGRAHPQTTTTTICYPFAHPVAPFSPHALTAFHLSLYCQLTSAGSNALTSHCTCPIHYTCVLIHCTCVLIPLHLCLNPTARVSLSTALVPKSFVAASHSQPGQGGQGS